MSRLLFVSSDTAYWVSKISKQCLHALSVVVGDRNNAEVYGTSLLYHYAFHIQQCEHWPYAMCNHGVAFRLLITRYGMKRTHGLN